MKKKSFIKFMLLAVLLVVGSVSVWGQATVNSILYNETFGGYGSSSTTFSASTMTNYDKSGTTTLVSADKSSITFSGSNAMYSTATATNMTSGHVWLNKSTVGNIQISGIPIYNASKIKVSFSQTGSGSIDVYANFGSGETKVGTSTAAAATFETAAFSTSGTTLILNIKRLSNSNNLRVDNITVTVTEITQTCTTPTFSFATPTSVSKLTTDAAFTNLLTSDNTSTKVWSSSNEAVATVNSSGLVTIVGAGTTTIGVTQVADGTRCAVSTSYALTVSTPTITLTPTTLTGFTYILGAGPSSQQTFTVSGTNLAGDISIAAPTNYEISKSSGSGYTTPLVYTPAQVSSAQTVYVRLKTGLSVASYNSETITATSTGATDKTVTCSGSVTAPSYTITPSSSNNSHGTVSLSGTVITATPAVGYTYASPAYTVTSGTADVTQNVNEFTVTPSSNCSVRINFEAKPTYTLSLSNVGEAYTDSNFPFTTYQGNTITLPDLADCGTFTFVGWDTNSSTTSAPTYVGGATYTTTGGNVTLYAVYSQTTGTPETWTEVVNLNDIVAGTYVILNGSFYLPNAVVTNGPAKTDISTKSVSVSSGSLSGTIASDMQWNFTGTNAAMTIVSTANTKYLYNIANNDGVNVGNTTDTWAFEVYSTGFAMIDATNSRYCAVYTAGSDWRSYTTKDAANYGTNGGILELYKKSGGSVTTYTTAPNCNAAQITISETELTGFGYVENNGPSAAQSFTVSGVNLSEGITIAAPAHYEVSLIEGSGYDTSLLLAETDGEVESTTVYVRLKAGLSFADYNNETITLSSAGADDGSINLNGTVTEAISEPTAHVTNFEAVVDGDDVIIIGWIDAASVDGYLIKASSTSYGSITAPIDGTTESNGTLVKNVAQGGEIVEFTGLSAGTNYYFKIYPYNGSGLEINYKTDGSVPEATALTSTPLSVPTAIAASGVSGNGFTANWNAVSGATAYDVNVYTKAGGGNASDLFISEYIEGSGDNKAIEIFNGTGAQVDLSDYTVYLYANGASTDAPTTTLALSGTLESGDVYVIATPNSNSTILSIADLTSSIANFNGDDALGLWKESTSSYVDIFGQIGTDPGSSWGTTPLVTVNKSLVRKGTVTSGVTTNPVTGFPTLATEWDSYSQDVTSYLGSHTFDNVASSTPITNSPFTVTGSTNKEVTGLNSGTAYYYTVVAKDAVTTTEASNEITAITAIDETVDVSTLPDCPTCDLVVNDGGVVTLNASKSYHSVSVKPGAKLTLNNGHTFAPGTFVLESNSLGTATFVDKRSDANKTNIIATVQQHLPAATDRLWWYLASPVSDDASTVFGSNKVGEYSETTRSYSNPFSEPTALVAGKGYVVKMTATEATNYIFENKTLNTGNISVPLTRTVTQTADNAKRGFNLVGNPYPSYLNWNMAYNASTNVRPSIWYRTLVYDEGKASYKMDFHTYNASLNVAVPISVSGYIPPMQAFWVKVDKDPTSGSVSNVTLNMTNDMRSHAGVTANPLKAPAVERPLVRLVISNGSASDETVIVAHTAALDGYDSFDSEKMANDNINKPEIYSIAGTQELVISGVSPLSVDKQLALGVRPGKSGDYSISVGELKGIPADLKVVLKDKHTGAFTELTDGTAYSFNTDGNTVNDRFSLLFRAKDISTDIDNGKYLDLQVYGQNGQIVLRSAKLTGAEILVFNALGQPLYAQQSEGTTCTVRGNFTPGVYLVKVNNEVRKVTLK